MTPWQTVASVLWATSTVAAVAVTIALPACRRSAWITVWPPLCLVALWWASLDVRLSLGAIDPADYADDVRWLAPTLLVLWTGIAAIYVARALRTDRIESSIRRMVDGDTDRHHERYPGDTS